VLSNYWTSADLRSGRRADHSGQLPSTPRVNQPREARDTMASLDSAFGSIDFFTDPSLVPDPHPYFDYLRSQNPVLRTQMVPATWAARAGSTRTAPAYSLLPVAAGTTSTFSPVSGACSILPPPR